MKPTTHQACLLLGSNIEAEINLTRAVDLLQEQLKVLQASSIWESASVDCCYPDYLNLALRVATSLKSNELKDQVLRPLEARMGRVRTDDKNASRPIDIDIILFDDIVLDPALWQHAHRAVPVSELFPEFKSETGESLKAVAKQLAQATPVRLRKDISVRLTSRS